MSLSAYNLLFSSLFSERLFFSIFTNALPIGAATWLEILWYHVNLIFMNPLSYYVSWKVVKLYHLPC